MEHKLLINQSGGVGGGGCGKGKEILSLVFSWNITNTNVHTHTGMLPFLLYPFFYSSKWRWYAEYNKSPGAATAFLKLAPRPLAVRLTLSHPLGELTSGLFSLMWRDIFIVQIKLAMLMITQGTAHLPPQSLWHVLSGVRRPSRGEQLFWIWPRAPTMLKGRPTIFIESCKRGPNPKQWSLQSNPEEQCLSES